jgi:hypothetical protein
MTERLFPANADARPHSRRQILRGLALSPVAVATGAGIALALTQAKASADQPDAALLALFAEWQASAAEDDAACEACADAHDRYLPPPVPKAIFSQQTDCFGIRALSRPHLDGRHRFEDARIEHLRRCYLSHVEGVWVSKFSRQRAAEIV